MSPLYAALVDLAAARKERNEAMSAWSDRTLDDDYRDELRAEAAAERRRLRPHWCRDCLGFTGPGSPCAPEEEDNEPEDSDDDA